jgi:hypothetical protein
MAGNRIAALKIRVVNIVGAAALCIAQVACYTLRPVAGPTMPDVGSVIAVDINDAGRAAMGGAMGPEIARIEGRLMGTGATEYELAVTTVHLLGGGEQVWRGERVPIKRDYVTRMYEKHFSAGRTTVASVAGASVVAYFAAKALLGAGLGDRRVPSDTGLGDMLRRPVRP